MSRASAASPDSDKESAIERGIEAARTEPLELLALLAPGKGIPTLAPLGPMPLYVDRMLESEAGQPAWLSKGTLKRDQRRSQRFAIGAKAAETPWGKRPLRRRKGRWQVVAQRPAEVLVLLDESNGQVAIALAAAWTAEAR